MNIQLTALQAKALLTATANPVRATQSQKFFKTGKGDYAEQDSFIGISVPQLRKIAKKFRELELSEIGTLLSSLIHEERLLALFILVDQYKKGKAAEQSTIFRFYLDYIEHVNNWDLVDSSAHLIIGPHLKTHDLLIELAQSPNLWKRRIAIIATWYNIKQNNFVPTVTIAKLLIHDQHDLIHKAVGWMLREMGKHDNNTLVDFLDEHLHSMPRTMLRYAIEKFPEEKRQFYLNK